MAFVDEVMNGQQLDGSDTEFLQIFDARFAGQSGVGSAQVFRHGLVEFGEAADVHFVNDGVSQRNLRRAIAFPVEVTHR